LPNKAQPATFTHAGDLLRRQYPNLVVSKRRLRWVDAIQMVRDNGEADRQNLDFCACPFDLCRLPVRRPPSGCLLHERRNGQFVLQVTGHGLPRGQDRLAPIFFATTRNRLATGPGGGHPPRPIQLHVGGRTWYSRDPDQRLLPGDCHKMIVLSDEFYRAILSHPIPPTWKLPRSFQPAP
jgi:hypothetical protein